jgi:chemotaxis signal transduction protein
MTISRALRLEAAGGCAVAVAPHDVVEILAEAKTTPVPLAPDHCRELIAWRDEMLPVFDLGRWRDPHAPAGKLLAVVAYQKSANDPVTHGCLRLDAFPKMISVDDLQACPLPDPSWRAIALSCFQDHDKAIPIVSLERVFNTSL